MIKYLLLIALLMACSNEDCISRKEVTDQINNAGQETVRKFRDGAENPDKVTTPIKDGKKRYTCF